LTGADTRRDAVTDKAVTGLTSTTGSGLNIKVSVDSDGTLTVTAIDAGGTNFLVGDKITVLDSAIVPGSNDGLEAADVILEVSSVSSNQTTQKLTDQVTLLFAKVNEIITAFND
jgi:hypothetical protein